MLPTKVNSIGLSVQEKRKIDFQDGIYLWFTIGTILPIFDLTVTPMLPTKLRVNWLSVQEKKRKIDFQDGLQRRLSWISDWNDFSYFWLISHPCFQPSFKSVGLRVQEKKLKNIFSRWRPSWISDRKDFSFFFFLQVTSISSTKFRVN